MSSSLRHPRRDRHVDLPTRQRRARHLRNLTIRNLSVKGMEAVLLSSYFTIHDPRNPLVELYRSEVLHQSVNPSWKTFNLEAQQRTAQPSFSTILVRIWVTGRLTANREQAVPTDATRLAIEWTVDLMALNFAGEHLFKLRIPSESNVLIFGMFEAYYMAPADEKLSQKALAATLYTPRLEVDAEAVRLTSNCNFLSRTTMIHRRLTTSQQSVERQADAFRHRCEADSQRQALANQLELNRCRIDHLAQELKRHHQCLLKEKHELEARRLHLTARSHALAEKREDLERSKSDLNETKLHLVDRGQLLYRVGTSLQARRCLMLRDLGLIFPIVEQARNGFCILGVNVPHSEALASQSDEAIAVGFGYAAQVIRTLALILNLPLRYPIIMRGSRSMLRDDITDVPSSIAGTNKGQYNLFPKQRADKDHMFMYALFLLNKNISQIRYYCELMTPDSRMTLKNIKTLLDRFGVLGERLASRSVYPLRDPPDMEDAIDGLPRPTRTFSVLPSFKGPSGSPVSNTGPVVPFLTPRSPHHQPAAADSGRPRAQGFGHRRQYSEPLTAVNAVMQADDDSQCLSAGASPKLEAKGGVRPIVGQSSGNS